MSQTTSIEWTDVSWNPVHGCSKVSPGCAHCYAETLSRRYGFTTAPWTPANAEGNVILKPHKLREPLSWRKPRMVFVNSMSDLFHEDVPDEYIDAVLGVMWQARKHTFQVLTKRPERAREYLSRASRTVTLDGYTERARARSVPLDEWPLPNVWLGVSIENRRFVHRADLLREIPAAVRFISAEPLLGPLIRPGARGVGCGCGWPLDGCNPRFARGRCGKEDFEDPGLDLTGIDWLIVGGESGPGHRPMRLAWARDLRDACQAAGTAYFVKQLGGARPGTKLEDLPPDLRIREYPRAAA